MFRNKLSDKMRVCLNKGSSYVFTELLYYSSKKYSFLEYTVEILQWDLLVYSRHVVTTLTNNSVSALYMYLFVSTNSKYSVLY